MAGSNLSSEQLDKLKAALAKAKGLPLAAAAQALKAEEEAQKAAAQER